MSTGRHVGFRSLFQKPAIGLQYTIHSAQDIAVYRQTNPDAMSVIELSETRLSLMLAFMLTDKCPEHLGVQWRGT